MIKENVGSSPQLPSSEQQRILVEELKPQIIGLIEEFKVKLGNAPEFQSELVREFLAGVGLRDYVRFQRGNYQYAISLHESPLQSDEEFEKSIDRGVGFSSGYTILDIGRTLSAQDNDKPRKYDGVKMEVYTFENPGESTQIKYFGTGQQGTEVNTSQALIKAQEIINQF